MRPLNRFSSGLPITWFAAFTCLVSAVMSYGQQSKPAASPVPPSGSVKKETSKGTISGEVLDESGKPLPNANIGVINMSGEPTLKMDATDDAGKFAIRNLPIGSYRLQVQAPAYIQRDEDVRAPDGSLRFYRTGENVSLALARGGVITGTVTDQSGAPVVGVNVTVLRVRQPNEPNLASDSYAGSRTTDDRGIYRIYGLRPGRYFVYAGAANAFGRPGPFDHDAPTFYPSSNRDSASIVSVQTGEEATGIDIRYRGERGYSISGSITGPVEKFVLLSLVLPGNPTPVASGFSQDNDGQYSFSFSNLVAGDYKVVAYTSDEKTGRAANGTINVSVKNGDVEGLAIKLSPLGAVSGRIVVPSAQESKCESTEVPGPEQTIISVRPEKRIIDNIFVDRQNDVGVQNNGEFRITSLTMGGYRLRTLLPTDNWYIKTIERPGSRPPANAQAKPSNTPAESVTINDGVGVSGMVINLAGEAGSVNGRVNSGAATDAAAQRLYLVPSETERADDTLRFAESSVASDRSFAFRNLAPGRYFLVLRTLKDTDTVRPLFWDAKERAALIADGASGGLAVEIKPCQSIRDLLIKLGTNGIIK